jgi:hypothetical protein
MTATATTQKLLAFRAELRLPVVDMAGARAILGLTDEEILEEVDVRKSIPAWNIAVDPDNSDRRELRLFGPACRDFAEHRAINTDPDYLIRRIYGPERPFLKGTWFRRSWNCERKTVIRLCESKALACLPLDPSTHRAFWSRGRNGTPAITWASAVAFLHQRRIK